MRLKGEILDIDYTRYVELLGTAHFTRRSLNEAYKAVQRLKPTDLAIELDVRRFRILNSLNRFTIGQSRKCEFIGAIDAFGNADADIWLIDMTEGEMKWRIETLLEDQYLWYSRVSYPWYRSLTDEYEMWELGLKDEVLERNMKRLEYLRLRAPHVWRVLIEERNAIMAARIAWIATQKLDGDEEPRILAIIGAAHVEGIEELLKNPVNIGEALRKLDIKFTPPALIRKVSIN